MDNNLDPSWQESLVDKNSSISRVYLLGASDFQRKAIEILERYCNGYIKDSEIDKRLRRSIELIKNLKYETKINSDS